MEFSVGKIYKTTVKKVSKNHFEMALIGIAGPKKYMVTKYHLILFEEKDKSRNNILTPRAKIVKTQYQSCKLRGNVNNGNDSCEYEFSENGKLVFSFSKDGLVEIASAEPRYVANALSIVEEQVIEPFWGDSFKDLGNEILRALTGSLMTGDSLNSCLKLTPAFNDENVDVVKLLSEISKYLIRSAADGNYKQYVPAAELHEIQKKYLKIVKKIFSVCDINSSKFETAERCCEELVARPLCVYEYLCRLSFEDIKGVVTEVAEFYSSLHSFCARNKIGANAGQTNPVTSALYQRNKSLSDCLSSYEYWADASVSIDENILLITRVTANDRAVFSREINHMLHFCFKRTNCLTKIYKKVLDLSRPRKRSFSLDKFNIFFIYSFKQWYN